MCPEPTEGIPTYIVSLSVSFVGGGSFFFFFWQIACISISQKQTFFFFKVVTANDSYILHANILTKIGLYVVS